MTMTTTIKRTTTTNTDGDDGAEDVDDDSTASLSNNHQQIPNADFYFGDGFVHAIDVWMHHSRNRHMLRQT